jgi:hypothetical protein
MKLAVGVMAKFLRLLLAEESVRVVLEAVERVADIAFDQRLSLVLLAEGIDLLGEVPVPEINSVPFRQKKCRSDRAPRAAFRETAEKCPVNGTEAILTNLFRNQTESRASS